MVDRILYEDNHLIVINKRSSEIVQGDKTGDKPLSEMVKLYLKEKYNKPGNVFLGVVHRIDRPVSGAVIFAKTSKSLSRMNRLLQEGKLNKLYWAVVEKMPPKEKGELIHYITRNRKQNKSYASITERKESRKAHLSYTLVGATKNYFLLEIKLYTGRHHQIRAQLAHEGCVIKGDLKYGARRSNPGGGIYLHAREVSFEHPVTKEYLEITAPVPNDALWNAFG